MDFYVDFLLVLTNTVVCGVRFYQALLARRIASCVWFLLLYFAIFTIPVAFIETVPIHRGFTDESFIVPHEFFRDSIHFVLAFNLLFLTVEVLLTRYWGDAKRPTPWQMSGAVKASAITSVLLFAFWLVGGGLYLQQTLSQGYRDYVEGASWPLVFLWASSPLIALEAMQRRFVRAGLLSLPFLYLAFHLSVRSFALLSLVPVLLIFIFQQTGEGKMRWIRVALSGFCILGILTLLSIWVSQNKTGEIAFPDSQMPKGLGQIMFLSQKLGFAQTGFASLANYGSNFLHPFARLGGMQMPRFDDPPIIIARMFEGMPKDWPVFYHYPSLISSDAFVSFGWWGILSAAFWALIVVGWEKLIAGRTQLQALLLPYFCWHAYMLVRGAVEIASVPFAYAAYFSTFAFLLGSGLKLFSRDAVLKHSRSRTGQIQARSLLRD